MIYQGDCLEILRNLPDQSVNCCVTSPPYWGLRDYGQDGQLGLEKTPEDYVNRMVDVFREVRRVLRDDGTCWVNLGDSYASGVVGNLGKTSVFASPKCSRGRSEKKLAANGNGRAAIPPGLKPKDIVGIPWRVAFALQADGWYLRQDIIWHKPNPMPESVRDRCTKAHEYIFLLSKSPRYFYDADAIKENSTGGHGGSAPNQHKRRSQNLCSNKTTLGVCLPETRNRRDVWTVATRPYSRAHFAVFPPQLIEPCILAGCPTGGVVLDPFFGSGTTGAVAVEHGRDYIGIELNPEYIELAKERIKKASDARTLVEVKQRVEWLETQVKVQAKQIKKLQGQQLSLFG